MKNLSLYLPTRYYFGYNSIDILAEKARGLGKKAFLVTGKRFLKEKGFLDRIFSDLREKGIDFVHYDNITPNPKVNEVDQGAEIARDQGCDFIIGIGGGSVMDASKGIAIVVKNRGSIWDYMMRQREPEKGALPIILVSTIPASGSEYNPGGVITHSEEKKKWFFRSDYTYPRISIVDPQFTEHLSFFYLAAGSIDMITHMLEPFLSAEDEGYIPNRFAVLLIKGAMEMTLKIKNNPEDKEAGANLCYISSLALCGIPTRGIGGSAMMHWIEHVLSGFYDNIAHPVGLAMLLVPFIRVMKEKFPENIKRFEDIYGIDDIEKLFKDYLEKTGLLISIKEYGVEKSDIERMLREYRLLTEKFPDFGLDKIEIENIRRIYTESYDLSYMS